jgi:hypothetical protein
MFYSYQFALSLHKTHKQQNYILFSILIYFKIASYEYQLN